MMSQMSSYILDESSLNNVRKVQILMDELTPCLLYTSQAYPEKAVIYSGASAPENGKAVMDAGGSCPNVK